MTTTFTHVAVLAATLLAISANSATTQAQPTPATTSPATTQNAASAALTIAILDFESSAPGNADLGKQISEMLTAVLTGESGFTLVDRSTLNRVLDEHELNLTGLVATDKAIQMGKLVGARLMITGKAFAIGEHLFITAKIIGTETSLVDGVLIKAKVGTDSGELVLQLAEKLNARLRQVGTQLVGDNEIVQDPLPALKLAMQKVQRPTVAVVISEEHTTHRRAVPDPAVETEVKRLLLACGFTVQDVPQNALADWLKDMRQNNTPAWPQALAGVDLVITGEAFSEFAARIGNLSSCLARAEINVIRRSDGRIVFAGSANTRAVDLAEDLAGKKALQKAGNLLGVKLLQQLAETLPAAGQPRQ